MRVRLSLIAAGSLAALMALAGCGSSASDSTFVHVVASTDVWASVTQQIAGSLAGSKVAITSFITNPDADPHSYEADVPDEVAISKADLVIENGGGYDDFMDTMLAAHHKSGDVLLNAVDISGHTAPAGGDLNEHVWYDFPTVAKVAGQIEAALAKDDPADAATYAANLKAFDAQLAAMESTEATLKRQYAGQGAAITEPVPLYLLQACGLVDETPTAFSHAIEDGTDVPPLLLAQTEQLFNKHRVTLLAYNEQTSDPQTTAVLNAAKAAGVAVVPVTETLPTGEDYLTWMKANLAAVRKALA